jgi:chromate transporter
MGAAQKAPCVNWPQLWALVVVFVPLSFVTIGGGNSILAGVQHESVTVHHWITSGEFLDLWAVSRATPGPNSLYVALIGYRVDGVAGAVCATLALFVPTSVLMVAMARVWRRYSGTKWLLAVEQGLAPIAAGLVLAGTLTILRVAEGGWLAWVVAAAAFVAFRFTNINPFGLLLAGGVLFVLTGL